MTAVRQQLRRRQQQCTATAQAASSAASEAAAAAVGLLLHSRQRPRLQHPCQAAICRTSGSCSCGFAAEAAAAATAAAWPQWPAAGAAAGALRAPLRCPRGGGDKSDTATAHRQLQRHRWARPAAAIEAAATARSSAAHLAQQQNCRWNRQGFDSGALVSCSRRLASQAQLPVRHAWSSLQQCLPHKEAPHSIAPILLQTLSQTRQRASTALCSSTPCLRCPLQVWALVGEEARVAAAKDTAAAPVIDITKHGELRNWLPVAAAGSLPQAAKLPPAQAQSATPTGLVWPA